LKFHIIYDIIFIYCFCLCITFDSERSFTVKITNIETVRTTKPIPLPGEYREAWFQPDGTPKTSYGISFTKITTDEGIIGYGPPGNADGYVKKCLIGADPCKIEGFWNSAMLGLDVIARGSYGGIDAALWDVVGKAANMPVYKLLGYNTDKVKVYAATSRLCSPEEHVEQAAHIVERGFKAIKLRFHRPNPKDDLKAAQAVRRAFPDLTIVVDANQNHRSARYIHWSRETAKIMCRELQDIGVYFFEEPLNRFDYDGLAMLSKEFDMFIAGGEHAQHIYEFKEHLVRGTYDVLQPDVILGDVGLTGIRKLGIAAEFYDKLIIPHVCGLGGFAFIFAATAAAAAGLRNCPMVEFPYDPPFITDENQQFFLKNMMTVDKDGYVALPQSPGLGIEIDETALSVYQ
jgi:L-alanine-DL-glutamate epimerase-like enolase superfamily enzyme